MIGVVESLSFAALVGIASIFSKRGLERESFDVMLVISLAVSTPVFLTLAMLTTGLGGMPLVGVAYAVVGGILGSVVGRALYLLGIEYIGPGKALSINATSPLYATVLAALVLEESITLATFVGTVVIVAGVVAISRDSRAEAESAGYSRAVVLVPLAGALLLALGVTFRKLALNTALEPIQAGTINMAVGFAVTAPILLARHGRSLTDVDRPALRNFLVASVFMAVAFVFYFQGLESLPANVFYPLIQTQPLFAVGLSAVFLRNLEIVTWRTGVGAVCVVAGVTTVLVG